MPPDSSHALDHLMRIANRDLMTVNPSARLKRAEGSEVFAIDE